jgi:hypothetical protein
MPAPRMRIGRLCVLIGIVFTVGSCGGIDQASILGSWGLSGIDFYGGMTLAGTPADVTGQGWSQGAANAVSRTWAVSGTADKLQFNYDDGTSVVFNSVRATSTNLYLDFTSDPSSGGFVFNR